jgi:EAL domain-containing protein (putative c-di-GMP-specific phosphodiesterase class I)
MGCLEIIVDPKQTAGSPKKSSLDKLLQQTLASLYERELEINLLIDYLKAAKNGSLPLGDDFQRQEPRAATVDFRVAEKLAQRRLLQKGLGDALSTNALYLAFEPIISATGDCVMVEALLRWIHPKHGAIPPSEFISLAERTGEIIPIGRWALRQACREAVTWPGTPPPAVSVNMSPTQILTGSFAADVFTALAESGLPADRLQIELTENLRASDLESLSAVLAELRSSGIRIALDDFGTGFSGLSYLRTLPIDRIKIDRSFIEGSDAGSLPILKAIVNMAQTLNLEIIAEGVETISQIETLLLLGTHYFQGFLFTGGSMAPGDIRDWLARRIPASLHQETKRAFTKVV